MKTKTILLAIALCCVVVSCERVLIYVLRFVPRDDLRGERFRRRRAERNVVAAVLRAFAHKGVPNILTALSRTYYHIIIKLIFQY